MSLFKSCSKSTDTGSTIGVSLNERRQIRRLSKRLHMGPPQVIGYSIRLLTWAADEVSEGRSFGTFDRQKKVAKEVQLPGFVGSLNRMEVLAQGA